ncbi:Protein kinase domain-containing protein ppk32 [Coemansia sp. RSA 1813]|nr:Protein kinase domain-containing protein ppk32 [Coemansia sp. RSA 1843]KAJ2211321.1 Protein kinase domain-containing protein ppk32 [Coemansia sp. RSA 487]KAJ2567821.1 Protein kinase domain-containing protein ppk32 [Coemansia sp. RSA 1813]
MEGYLNKLRGLASSAVNAIQSKIGRDYAVDLNVPAVGHSGLWALHQATRRNSGNGATHVTVWVFEKRYFEQGINRQLFTEREQSLVVERLRAEAGQLARLRHPSVLQVVEPLEETRTWLMFVTEQVIASLDDLIGKTDSVRRVTDEEEEFVLDDLEIQKGLLQVSKALGFLHTDARIVHGNLVPPSVLVNAKGDWKLGGFGFAQPSNTTNPTRFEHDYQMPEHTQQDLDYLAPEYVLHGSWSPACDVFSFGCLVAAVYSSEGRSPLDCRNDVGAYQRELTRLLSEPTMQVPEDLLASVTGLLRTDPATRATLREFQGAKYFDDVRVATLRYLENLVEQPDDQKILFLRSLVRILPRFPDRVLRCKILTLLYEQATDRQLLPALMPSILFIVGRLTVREFTVRALPGLKPLLVAVQESSPQAICVVLDHLAVLEEKSPRDVFRSDVMALVYGALVSADPRVQDKTLSAVPAIAKSLDPSDMQEKLLPRVQHVYARASVLSHKVRALICLHGMLRALDKQTIITKVMPMLKRTKTREPAVVMAMLAMYEELGLRHLDKQAVASEVLPVLWGQCVDGRLKAEQFARFMQVIRTLGERVEREHLEYLDKRGSASLSDESKQYIVSDHDDLASIHDEDTSAFESLVLGSSANGSNNGAPSPSSQKRSRQKQQQQTTMKNPLADLDAPPSTGGKDSGWAWDADEPPAAQKPLTPGGSSAMRPTASTAPVDVDFTSATNSITDDDEFGAFGSYVSPTMTPAKPTSPTQNSISARLRTTTPQRFGFGATLGSSAQTTSTSQSFLPPPPPQQRQAASFTKPMVNGQRNMSASQVVQNAANRNNTLPNYNISPPLMTPFVQAASSSSSLMPQRKLNPAEQTRGAANNSKFSASQKHAGGKASDLGDFDPFA